MMAPLRSLRPPTGHVDLADVIFLNHHVPLRPLEVALHHSGDVARLRCDNTLTFLLTYLYYYIFFTHLFFLSLFFLTYLFLLTFFLLLVFYVLFCKLIIRPLTGHVDLANVILLYHHVPLGPLKVTRHHSGRVPQLRRDTTFPEASASVCARGRDQVRGKACWVDGRGTEVAGGHRRTHDLHAGG